jgi:anti-sigma factor RsiW
MMDYDLQLKLQALLDGELPEAEASEVAQRLARDPEAAALQEELRNTREAVAGFEAGIQLPESREFFWSKVQREIERLEAPVTKPAAAPLSALLRRFLVPASAVALLFVTGVVLTRPIGPLGRTPAAEIETALAGSGVFSYRDYSAGTTLVWLSYPADVEVAEDDEMGAFE